MKKFIVKNNKGSTLIEFVIAIALFGVISIPLMTSFTGSAMLLKKSKENIDINSISRQIKVEVNKALRQSNPRLPKYGGGEEDINFNNAEKKHSNLGVVVSYGSFNSPHPDYKYTIVKENYISNPIIATPIIEDPDSIPTIVENETCRVQIYKKTSVGTFKLERAFIITIPVK